MALVMNVQASFGAYTFSEATVARVTMSGDHVTHSADISTWLTYQSIQRKSIFVTLINDDPNPSSAGGGVVPGAEATLTIILKGAGGGANRTFSGPAICLSADVGGAHAEVSAANGWAFCMVSTDGAATPLTTNT